MKGVSWGEDSGWERIPRDDGVDMRMDIGSVGVGRCWLLTMLTMLNDILAAVECCCRK